MSSKENIAENSYPNYTASAYLHLTEAELFVGPSHFHEQRMALQLARNLNPALNTRPALMRDGLAPPIHYTLHFSLATWTDFALHFVTALFSDHIAHEHAQYLVCLPMLDDLNNTTHQPESTHSVERGSVLRSGVRLQQSLWIPPAAPALPDPPFHGVVAVSSQRSSSGQSGCLVG